MNRIEWKGFKPGSWQTVIDVGSFIRKNYTPYDEDASFLSEPTEKTTALWNICKELLNSEIKKAEFWILIPAQCQELLATRPDI